MIILVFAVCLLLYGPYSYSFRQQPGLAIIMVVLVWHMYFLFRSQCYEGPESFLWLVVVEMRKEKANMYGMSFNSGSTTYIYCLHPVWERMH